MLEEVRARRITLECCPISNQVLGYFPDLAAHPAVGLLRAGIPMTISPDDPGMWHYCDVSYDFAAVVGAWNLTLTELKALARNSLTFSTLRGKQREEAVQAWEADWERWIEAENKQLGTKG
uniref:Adenosine deaminase domain-containing protein n=1 Tax=Zooxanthella nutricula TaxID=1333877 RepID=A0A7S2QBN3_9DINO